MTQPTIAGQLSRRMAKVRYRVLVADCFLLLLLGLIYAWSIFAEPLEMEFGWTRAQTSLAFSIGNIASSLAGFFAATASRRIRPRRLAIAAGGLLGIGFFWASVLQTRWELYLAYGVLCCCGIGAAYNQILSTIVLWFQDQSGRASGIALMCYGVGSFAFSAVASWAVEKFGWRVTFQGAGIVCLVALVSLSWAVCRPTQAQKEQLPQVIQNEALTGASPRQLVRDPAFWIFGLRNLCLGVIGLTVSGHAAMLAGEAGVSARAAVLCVGIYSVSNGLGRLLFGALFDRFDQFRVMRFGALVAISGTALMAVAFVLEHTLLIFGAFAVLGVTFGSAPISSAAYVKRRYGDAFYASNLSFSNLCVIAASYIGPYFSGLLYQQGGYGLVIALLGVSAALVLLLTMLLKTSFS